MKKVFLFLICIFSFVFAFSQRTYDTVMRGNDNAAVNVRITIPQWYLTDNNTSDSAQMCITFLGLGEVGTDTNMLTHFGPHSYMKSGWDGSVTLGNGKHYPIWVTVQVPTNYYRPFNLKAIRDALVSRFRVLTKGRHVDGYSMGGWESNQLVTYRPTSTDSITYGRFFKSVVNIQGVKPDDTYDGTPAYPTKFTSYAFLGGKEWGFEQSNDFRDIQTIVNTMNSAVSGSAVYQQTTFSGGIHCCFNQWYGDSTGLVPGVWSFNGLSENIYQFHLRTGDTINDVHNSNGPPIVTAGNNQVISLPTTSAVLSGTATPLGTNTIVSTTWSKISGPNSFSITNPGNLTTTVTSLVIGVYTFKLTAVDNMAQSGSATVQITVNPASSAPTANAGGTYNVTPNFLYDAVQNSYDLILHGTATGTNLKYTWTIPCACYLGNDKVTQRQNVGADPRVAAVKGANTLTPQIIQMSLNEGDSIHIYKILFDVWDTVQNVHAYDTAYIHYTYPPVYPPQNTDGAAGGHFATAGDIINHPTWTSDDWVITGANQDPIHTPSGTKFTSYITRPNFSDTFHVKPGAQVHFPAGTYYLIQMFWDTVGSAYPPIGDTTKAQIIISPYGGQVRTLYSSQFSNIINTRITGVYDPVKGLGDIRYQGDDNGWANVDTAFGWMSDGCYMSIANFGFQVDGVSSQWVEIDHCASIRGHFSGFTIKAEWNEFANQATHLQTYWNGFKVHDNFVSGAHGEDFYYGSANTPAIWINNLDFHDNVSLYSGNKLFKTLNLYRGNRIHNNTGYCGSINWPSSFEEGVSVGQEASIIDTGNRIDHNLLYGFGNQGLNFLTTYATIIQTGLTARVDHNVYFGSKGPLGSGFLGQQDSAQKVLIDSNYFGFHGPFKFGQVYNGGGYGTNTALQLQALPLGSFGAGTTFSTYTVKFNNYDTTKTTLTGGQATFVNSNNTQSNTLTQPSFVNVPFIGRGGQLPTQWVDLIYAMWGDEYAQGTDVFQGKPFVYQQGDIVKWFDKFYVSNINNNTNNPPTGNTDANWTLIKDPVTNSNLFSNDIRLNAGSLYQGIGVTNTFTPNSHQDFIILHNKVIH